MTTSQAPRHQMKSMLGMDRIEELTTLLRDRKRDVQESDLPEQDKFNVDRELSRAIRNLSTGTIIERLSAAQKIQSGDDPLNDVMRDMLRDKLSGSSPTDAAMGELMRKIVATVPVGTQPSATQSAMDQLAADLLRERFVGPKTESPMDEASRQVTSTLVERALKTLTSSPPNAIEQLQMSVAQLGQMKQLAEALGWTARPSAVVQKDPEVEAKLEERRLALEDKRLDSEIKLREREIEQQASVQIAEAQARSEMAKTLSGGLETIGQVLGETLMRNMGRTPTGPAREASPGGRQQQREAHPGGTKVMNCPDCHVDTVYVTPALQELVESGQTVNVSCSNCGVNHTLSPGNPGEPDVQEGQEPGPLNVDPFSTYRETEDEPAEDDSYKPDFVRVR